MRNPRSEKKLHRLACVYINRHSNRPTDRYRVTHSTQSEIVPSSFIHFNYLSLNMPCGHTFGNCLKGVCADFKEDPVETSYVCINNYGCIPCRPCGLRRERWPAERARAQGSSGIVHDQYQLASMNATAQIRPDRQVASQLGTLLPAPGYATSRPSQLPLYNPTAVPTPDNRRQEAPFTRTGSIPISRSPHTVPPSTFGGSGRVTDYNSQPPQTVGSGTIQPESSLYPPGRSLNSSLMSGSAPQDPSPIIWGDIEGTILPSGERTLSAEDIERMTATLNALTAERSKTADAQRFE